MKTIRQLRSQWENRPIANPTQSAYVRFIKQPSSEIKSQFTEAVKKFQEQQRRSLKSSYFQMEEEV